VWPVRKGDEHFINDIGALPVQRQHHHKVILGCEWPLPRSQIKSFNEGFGR
jgi:hypothetical protein